MLMSRPPLQPLAAVLSDPSGLSGQAVEPICVDEITAAELLCVGPTHLANLRKAGLVPWLALGGRIVYPLVLLRSYAIAAAFKPALMADPSADALDESGAA